MTRHLVIAAMVALVLASCSPSAPKQAAEIDKLENELKESSNKNMADTAKVHQLMRDYRSYAGTFPTDSLTPVYMMKLAKFYDGMRLTDSALYYYSHVYQNYPAYPKLSVALFSEAFIYNNEKHDLAKAGALYQEYLNKYPNTVLAQSANMELHNLGKSPEQIMAEMDSIRNTKADTTLTTKK
jgi:TolA-binding protein